MYVIMLLFFLMQVDSDTSTLPTGDNYRLTLPVRAGTGTCVPAAPIPYLQDRSETCVWRMQTSLCSATSPLNALNYALPTLGQYSGTLRFGDVRSVTSHYALPTSGK